MQKKISEGVYSTLDCLLCTSSLLLFSAIGSPAADSEVEHRFHLGNVHTDRPCAPVQPRTTANKQQQFWWPVVGGLYSSSPETRPQRRQQSIGSEVTHHHCHLLIFIST